MEKKRPNLKPLKILVNLFAKSKHKSQERASCSHLDSQLSPPPTIRTQADFHTPLPDSVSMAPSLLHPDVYTEFEALHLSRQDNPFLQKQLMSLSHDDLDALMQDNHPQQQQSYYGGSVFSGGGSMCSPPYSPTRSCDPLVLEEVHAHLIRSPPPVTWPQQQQQLSPRSNCTFSPVSSEGNDLDFVGANYYRRSQSEEHILSPCCSSSRDLHLKTPEPVMTASFHYGQQKVRRNHTMTVAEEQTTLSPLRNQAGYDYGSMSVSSYTMNHQGSGRRSIGARSQLQRKGESSSSSWRPQRRGRRPSSEQQEDARSMENILLTLPVGCSPAARKSVCSMGGSGGGHSPRNCATMFTKWRVTDPPTMFIT